MTATAPSGAPSAPEGFSSHRPEQNYKHILDHCKGVTGAIKNQAVEAQQLAPYALSGSVHERHRCEASSL